MRDLYFVSCTRGAKEETLLYRTLVRHGLTSYRFFEHNKLGLPFCYNEVLNERAGKDEVIVFAHDDILIGDISLREKIIGEVEDGADIVGVVGANTFLVNPLGRLTTWLQENHTHNSGGCDLLRADEEGKPVYHPQCFGPRPMRCVVMDGLLLAVAADRIGAVRYDEQFSFHFYDLDFCLSARQAGLHLTTTNLYLAHASPGDFISPSFQFAQDAFRQKWRKFHAIGVAHHEYAAVAE